MSSESNQDYQRSELNSDNEKEEGAREEAIVEHPQHPPSLSLRSTVSLFDDTSTSSISPSPHASRDDDINNYDDEPSSSTSREKLSQFANLLDCSNPSSTLCMPSLTDPKTNDTEEGLDEPMPFSNLSDLSRNIWIVTTAALPWRTGTAINPFLRALYLIKSRLDLGLYSCHDDDGKIKAGKITLVIPWLVDISHAKKLFGPSIITESDPNLGKQQQIQWMQKYAKEQCNMENEMNYLNILFYDAKYWPSFGSILPSVDICSLIPDDEADVAILEEPEHLNWFRVNHAVIENAATEQASNSDNNVGGDEEMEPKQSISTEDNTAINIENVNSTSVDVCKSNDIKGNNDDSNMSIDGNDGSNHNIQIGDEQKHHELGWAQKFNFVVGIIHTNYSAYMKQYGIGSSIVAAPALNALSTMVVRAYCHKVIRLSAVIPSYAKWKECTCNVHGVRSDFLGSQSNITAQSSKPTTDDPDVEEHSMSNQEKPKQQAQIYFIGKLLWAKGFDRMLKVQEMYRESNPEKEYFPIDVYGSGPDETAICRAFHGRLQSPSTRSDSPTRLTEKRKFDVDESGSSNASTSIFTKNTSLRKQLFNLVHRKDPESSPAHNDAEDYINMGFELIDTNKADQEVLVMERKVSVSDVDKVVVDPLSIISEVSGDLASTSMTTAEAMRNLADNAMKAGLAMTFSHDEELEDENGDDLVKPSFIFDPPKTLFELRRNSIPAQFLGVKDHALLRDLPYKIFLNPSVTEVLCTTTAEALAMGKFVIIPDHPSNEFFLQFPNCLAYKTIQECVEKIKWALENKPEPLSQEQAYIFTWEAATDRLIEASYITKREARERTKDGHDKSDLRMAWIHSEGGKKGQFLKGLFAGKNENTNVNDCVEGTIPSAS